MQRIYLQASRRKNELKTSALTIKQVNAWKGVPSEFTPSMSTTGYIFCENFINNLKENTYT